MAITAAAMTVVAAHPKNSKRGLAVNFPIAEPRLTT
jgi:hypothetical protein